MGIENGEEREARHIDMWIGARLGLRSGVYGGVVAGLGAGLLAATVVLFTDIQFTRLVLFNIFWLAGIYGFVLGVLAGALGGLVAGAIIGATRVPRRLTLAGALAGAGGAFMLIMFFFGLYAWLNTGTVSAQIFVNLFPVGMLAALVGGTAGALAGRRFRAYYVLRPRVSDYDYAQRWQE